MPRLQVPISANHLTAFINVQQKVLFYVVAAWEDDFTGYVIDYGTYPNQKRNYFTLRDARLTLASSAEGTGLEGSIYAGLESLTESLLGQEWHRDDGAAMKIERCLIDANWGHSTNVVYQFCRQSPFASVLLPSHGRFVGASSNPFSEYKRRPGDRVALNWRVPSIHGKRAIRHCIYDTNCGSHSPTRGSPCLWATEAASPSSVAASNNIACSPNKSPLSTSSKPKAAAVPSTNGNPAPNNPTTTGSTVSSAPPSPRRCKEHSNSTPLWHLMCPHSPIHAYEGRDWGMDSASLCGFDVSRAATGVESAQRAANAAGVSPSSEL